MNELYNNIYKYIRKEKLFISTDIGYIYLCYLKYLCEKKEYDINKIIEKDNLSEIKLNLEIPQILKLQQTKIHKLLLDIHIDSKTLIKEYLEEKQPFIDIEEEKKLILILKNSNINLYDIKGNTTYVYETLSNELYIYKIIDKILNKKNKYIQLDKLKYENYKYIYIIDDGPQYRFIKENKEISYYIMKFIANNLKVILYTNYKKVNTFTKGRRVIDTLKTIILKEERVLIIFDHKENNSVSIINYDINKIKDITKLKQIINNNRKQKDILIKTTSDKIKDNNMRIGFKLYQIENQDKLFDINKIVDENTHLIEKLSAIDQTVQSEINRLLNR